MGVGQGNGRGGAGCAGAYSLTHGFFCCFDSPATPQALERVKDLPKYEPVLPVNSLSIITYTEVRHTRMHDEDEEAGAGVTCSALFEEAL